jgi:hypothetical protein
MNNYEATVLIEGTKWYPGIPFTCQSCGATLELGESCNHLIHADDGIKIRLSMDGYDPARGLR